MKKFSIPDSLAMFCLAFMVVANLAVTPIFSASPADAPPFKARAPKIPRITSADQLVPFVKVILQRDYIGQRLGWGIKGGERVLLQVSGDTHPLVVDAFVQGLHELNCLVDVSIKDAIIPGFSWATWSKELTKRMQVRLSKDFNVPPPASEITGWGGSGIPRPRRRGIVFNDATLNNYDIIIGPNGKVPGLAGQINWAMPEELACLAEIIPGELMDRIDEKAWALIRNAAKITITDLQGTKTEFTWFPEWWEIVEGTHPKYRSPADMSTFNALRPGRSEFAVFAGHLMGHPREAAIEGTDFRGDIVATVGDFGMMPTKMTVTHQNGEIKKITSGGDYGRMWWEHIDLTKDILYPGYSRPGTAWMGEFSLGTNPKFLGPTEVPELKGADRHDLSTMSWGRVRDRSGMYHAGYGARGASWWAQDMDMPVGHYHMFLYFVTYEVELRDGRKVKLVDRGHLTILDDPEIRAMAAQYGDPDKILSEDWIPELTPDGQLKAPKSELIPYDQWLASLPLKPTDPRLIYRIPEKLKKFYSEDRVRYYVKDEFIDFYKKQGVIPVKRVNK